jgi:SM-20-related protein
MGQGMAAAATLGAASFKAAGGRARCPHLILKDVLGPTMVEELLAHVELHQDDFQPAIIRSRRTGEARVNPRQRDCLFLRDLGPCRQAFEAFLRDAAPRMLSGLQLDKTNVEPRELEICAYGEGSHFGTHVDTNELADRVRVISCVYYFARTPRAFSGGELRLHGFPLGSTSAEPTFVDVVPECDTLVAFPSWLRHEVLPVHVPSGKWSDCRFSINCWMLRAQPAADATAARA